LFFYVSERFTYQTEKGGFVTMCSLKGSKWKMKCPKEKLK